jgi:tetratricopeptide (TPR) repeat protein
VVGAWSVAAVDHPTAVVVTARRSLGADREVMVPALGVADFHELVRSMPAVPERAAESLCLASGGRPGTAHGLAGALADLAPDDDPIVYLALRVTSQADFLDVDPDVVRLLEAALDHAAGRSDRARLLARLAHELLGDSTAGERRRTLADEALASARSIGDDDTLASVLDDRLHALWDPAGAKDRLETATQIVVLARRSGDRVRERRGLFWRFVALMELGRVAEAEAALASYERASTDDPTATVVVTSRRAMLAVVRGRYDLAERLIGEVRTAGHRIRLADTDRLVGALEGAIGADRGPRDDAQWIAAIDEILGLSLRLPGHHFETMVAVILVTMGRSDEAAVELERLLPQVLAGSGPRWLSAMADLSVVAAETGDTDAAARLEAGLAPYRGQLVVRGGANTMIGPVSYFLGRLALVQGRTDDAASLLEEAVAFQEETGALPGLARSLWALADAQGAGPVADDHRRRATSIAERLGLRPLLERAAASADQWSLAHEGDDWMLAAGDEHARLRDTLGLGHLRSLLAAPGVDIAALDLVSGGAGLAANTATPVLDDEARQRYRARLDALEREADAADRSGDAGRAAAIETERVAILDELRRATGLGGRSRAVPAEAERARVNVTRTLRATLDRISEVAPRCGQHLQASIQTGRTCRYEPAAGGPSSWRV